MGILDKLLKRSSATRPGSDLPVASHVAAMTVKSSPERIASEQRMQAEAFVEIETQLSASGLFKPDAIPGMMAAIRANSPPFTPINAHLILGRKARPEAEHARVSLADCLSPQAGDAPDPTDLIKAVCERVAALTRNRHALLKIGSLGIQAVRIGIVKETACAKAKALMETYPIKEAPALPLPDCDAKHCHCGYRSVMPETS